MFLWLLGIGFGLLGISWFTLEYASAFRFSADYRLSYIKERLNYLTPLYLIGAAAVALTLISWIEPWYKVYISYVTVLGLTVGGKVFFNRMRRGLIRALDVYDLDLDLPIVSAAVSLISLNSIINILMINLISTVALFLESVIIYVRASRKLFDVGRVSAVLYSLPQLVIALYALYVSVRSIIVFVIALFVLALFIGDLAYLMIKSP
ncbi:hypothetical protein [Vulcanisaeta distributa]|uniref:Uncharacterized protein n=1 Tax=Vulcanisaeta distributa (strain DSM 14429 / JCM 11212 / NBRC 100878 / IC-017) TaxID=572478 RepID=E1QUN7_VULDI|nr:hypothetical protein [Vulcanisaeta distributa]ADN51156.1 hypothetical protein Vdis_1782 [Vulcanisaeta distributa DSM 14429]